jgi:protein-S-isoprenylcysteine O-methyltransferase Ste14
MDLCKHKDIFGKPNEGSHSTRIPGINVSASDTFAVLIIGLLISWFSGYSYLGVIGVIFISGIIAHRSFCVRTTVDRVLFPNLT